MNIEHLKKVACDAVDEYAEELISIGRMLRDMPETGFKEYKSSAFVKEKLEALGLEVKDKIAITGLKSVAKGKNSFVNVALISELDALSCPNHIFADKTNGAGHACCHYTQSVVLIGVATALIKTGIIKELDGDITFMCVPAEEAIEGDFRRSLKEEGKIEFLSGKQEFIRLGMLEDVDAAICQHPVPAGKEEYYACGHTYNGIISKKVVFNGKSAHAALCPENGINALQAAVNAINNINSLLETFSLNDCVRVHYIITNGGTSSNIVPNRVEMEMGVRAKTTSKMIEVNKKVNEALRDGAQIIGATVDILDYNAYLPFSQNSELTNIFLKNAALFTDNVFDISNDHRGSSTDAGDFASVVPTIHPVYGGVHGVLHADDCYIENERLAYVQSIKPIVCTIIELLSNQGILVKNVMDNFNPEFQNDSEYIDFYKKLFSGSL